MRILHVAQSIPGGIASYFEEIAGYQNRHLGAEAVRFLIPAGSRHHVPSISNTQIVEFAPSGRSVHGLFALGQETFREIRRFSPTIIHLHSTFAGAIARPIALFSRPKPKVVYCPHGWVFGMELPQWKRKLFSLVERSFSPLTDSIVNISFTDQQMARLNGLPPSKMVTIRNGIAECHPGSRSVQIIFPSNKIHLVFVGRHDRQKGLDILLEHFTNSDLKNVHLHVVGAPILDRSPNKLNTPPPASVTFYGWQPREIVSELMSSVDALIMPSRWEGFGLVALEAMRLGKPTIASRRGALPELIHDGQTGLLFDLEQPDALREILGNLSKDSLAAMGQAAHSEFLRHYTSERLNVELLDLYRTLLHRERDQSILVNRHQNTATQLSYTNEIVQS